MKNITFVLSVVLMMSLIIASTATGDYYQYTDPDGTVRFTDDPSLISADQRAETQVYDSVVSFPAVPESRYTPAEEAVSADALVDAPADGESASADAGTTPPNSEARVEAAELDAMRGQLIHAYKELEAAKKALGDPPPENAKSGVKGDYVQMSRELNLKIEAYNQMSKGFDEKVRVFNSRIMKK